jgi:hypothetical protein
MRLKPPSHLATREIRGEFVVIDTKSGNYHIFNEVGRLIWQGVEAGRESEAIVSDLVSSYQVTTDQARRDFEAFVKDLWGYGLLEEIIHS